MDSNPVVIIGAGVAGLTCARILADQGWPVALFEASDAVGGRVRSEIHPSGFILDRGFQVVLDAYPALKRQLDLGVLDLQPFDSAAVVWTGQRRRLLADPLRHPSTIWEDARTSVIAPADKLRIAKLAARARLAGWRQAKDAAGDEDDSTLSTLVDEGFSPRFIERFARPFWGGISLDHELGGSRGPFLFTLKMFVEGSATLPGAGMQRVPDALASLLPPGVVQLNKRVTRIEVTGSRATGVVVDGAVVGARSVVAATDPVSALALTGIDGIPADGLGCTTVFLRGQREPGVGKRLVLNGSGTGKVNHLAPLSTVAPSYAPQGEHLLAAVLLGQEHLHEADDEKLGQDVITESARMLGHLTSDWALLEVRRTPFAQYAQPPGIYQSLPNVETATAGLFLAGETTVDSSLNGAIISGETAAKAVMSELTR
jgi:phytoene dehydrogenase-like protein